jgi:hypothetical protein
MLFTACIMFLEKLSALKYHCYLPLVFFCSDLSLIVLELNNLMFIFIFSSLLNFIFFIGTLSRNVFQRPWTFKYGPKFGPVKPVKPSSLST